MCWPRIGPRPTGQAVNLNPHGTDFRRQPACLHGTLFLHLMNNLVVFQAERTSIDKQQNDIDHYNPRAERKVDFDGRWNIELEL